MKEFIFEGTLNGKIIKDYIDANDKNQAEKLLKRRKIKIQKPLPSFLCQEILDSHTLQLKTKPIVIQFLLKKVSIPLGTLHKEQKLLYSHHGGFRRVRSRRY